MDYIWWALGYETETPTQKPVAEANITREKRREESIKRRQQRKSYQRDKIFREALNDFAKHTSRGGTIVKKGSQNNYS